MTTTDYISVAAYTIAFIVWLVRLEMKVRTVTEEFARCRKTSNECRVDQTRRYELVREKLDTLLEDVGWIRGFLKNGKGPEGQHHDDP